MPLHKENRKKEKCKETYMGGHGHLDANGAKLATSDSKQKHLMHAFSTEHHTLDV